MSTTRSPLREILNKLEKHYGPQKVFWPTDSYEFIIWWHCGYPASDAACAKGWTALTRATGITPEEILSAPMPKLAAALKVGGMVPELRAMRLKEIAARVHDDFGGDLRANLPASPEDARKALKKFPNIADPGADRILLFAGLDPVAAVPSNCPHVLVRIQRGRERDNYGVTYREAQQGIEATTPDFDARRRAYLLLKCHGQQICKRNPKCDQCPVSNVCEYYRGKDRGRHAVAS
jgi:endonuclease-3